MTGSKLPRNMDEGTKKTISSLPLMTVNAGPRDGDKWKDRLKEEYTALIKYIQLGKETDTDWFQIESNKEGTVWTGKVWYVYEMKKFEFDLKFDIPVSYPATSPELALPELDGKTSKMYRGGKVCLTVHFDPLWHRNVPKFGIAHAMALGMGPWLAAEVPDLFSKGLITPAADKK